MLHPIRIGFDGRARQIRSPSCIFGLRKVKHKMGRPVRGAVATISVFRQHVAHRPGFHRRQLPLADGGDNSFAHLRSRPPCQDQVRLFDVVWKVGSHGRLVKAHRDPYFRVPKVSVRRGRPRTRHHAYETVFAFDGLAVSERVSSNACVASRCRDRTARQRHRWPDPS